MLSCCTWALSGPEDEILTRVAEAGFRFIDVRPLALTSRPGQASEFGLQVSCVAASFGMPKGVALESPEPQAAEEAHEFLARALDYSAALGATTAYAVPGKDADGETRSRYAAALARAADQASAIGLKFCVEHFPGTILPTVSDTLALLREIGHPNLYLLFDLGHAQMSGEDPRAALAAAGPRLGYVHLDDNDGRNDQHLGLLDGVLEEATLRQTFAGLADIGYAGAVSLELNPELPDPLEALVQSRAIVNRVAAIT